MYHRKLQNHAARKLIVETDTGARLMVEAEAKMLTSRLHGVGGNHSSPECDMHGRVHLL